MSAAVEVVLESPDPIERALAAAMSDDLPTPHRDILDPDKTPVEFLPFLAAQESVDLWYSDWSEARKRLMVKMAPQLAALIGTRGAAEAFLPFVDAEIVHKRSYPARFPVGRIAVGVTPIYHPVFTARFLLKVALRAPRAAVLVGRSAVGRVSLRAVDREPLRRAKRALSVSKAPETDFTVSFAHRRLRTLDEGVDLDAGHVLGSFTDRKSL